VSYFDERRSVGRRGVVQQLIAVVDDELSEYIPRIANRLGRRQHIERYRQRATLGDVHQPQTSSGKLPLHVTVTLHTGHAHCKTRPHTVKFEVAEQNSEVVIVKNIVFAHNSAEDCI